MNKPMLHSTANQAVQVEASEPNAQALVLEQLLYVQERYESLHHTNQMHKTTAHQRLTTQKKLNEQMQKYRKELNEQRSKLKWLRDTRQKHLEKLAWYDTEQQSSQQTNQTLSHQLSQSEAALASVKHSNQQLEQQLAQHRAELNVLRGQQAKYQQVAKAFSQQQQNNRDLQVKLARSVMQRQQLAQQLARMKQSILGRLWQWYQHKFSRGPVVAAEDIEVVQASPLFDAALYLENYPDVAAAGLTAAEHYLRYGASEGREPSKDFDGSWYLSYYDDVADSGINPLLHFERFGRAEGRLPRPKL